VVFGVCCSPGRNHNPNSGESFRRQKNSNVSRSTASLIMYTASNEREVHARVIDFAPLVHRLARHMLVGLPASVELDDLIQSGMMGLLEAAGRYESRPGGKFKTYAIQRIRGAMLDGLRQCDWAPRLIRTAQRRLDSMISRLEQKHGRSPTTIERAEALGMGVTEYQQLLHEVRSNQIVSYEDLGSDEEEDPFVECYSAAHEGDPLRTLEDRKLREALVESIEELPEREKLVMSLHYEQELNLREIGEALGVSESRVCQILSRSIATLRARLGGEHSLI
jgi:RNA polymerase sigma factor FliA